MSEIYPQYSDKVDLYALNIDATATDAEIAAYAQDKGLTFPVGFPGGRMVADFNIKRQASKVALKPDGTVLYSAGYGSGGMAEYESVLQQLAEVAGDPAQDGASVAPDEPQAGEDDGLAAVADPDVEEGANVGQRIPAFLRPRQGLREGHVRAAIRRRTARVLLLLHHLVTEVPLRVAEPQGHLPQVLGRP